MATVEQRISALTEKLKQELLKKDRLDAKKKEASAKKTRAQETRKKVLVGSVILARVEHGEWPADRLTAMMDKALTRADDRALFGLAPIATPEAKPEAGPEETSEAAPEAGPEEPKASAVVS